MMGMGKEGERKRLGRGKERKEKKLLGIWTEKERVENIEQRENSFKSSSVLSR